MVKNLRVLRIQKGVSQQKVADHLKTTQQSIYRYEKDKIEPDIATLIALADYFGTTVDYLIGHTPTGENDPSGELELSKDELALVRDMRLLTQEEKKSILLIVGNYLRAKND